MADKPEAKKRLVKNPETFRERAQKASQDNEKPKRLERVRKASGKATSPVRAGASKVGQFGPFKILRRPLRIVGRILLPKYIRNSWQELRLVKWPGWRESRRLTFAVLVFALIFGASIAAVDFGLDKLFRDILLK